MQEIFNRCCLCSQVLPSSWEGNLTFCLFLMLPAACLCFQLLPAWWTTGIIKCAFRFTRCTGLKATCPFWAPFCYFWLSFFWACFLIDFWRHFDVKLTSVWAPNGTKHWQNLKNVKHVIFAYPPHENLKNEGPRVPKPLQKVVWKVSRFWITFLMVFGSILDPKMLPKWLQNDPQTPSGDPQGVTMIPQGATKVSKNPPRAGTTMEPPSQKAPFWTKFCRFLFHFRLSLDKFRV